MERGGVCLDIDEKSGCPRLGQGDGFFGQPVIFWFFCGFCGFLRIFWPNLRKIYKQGCLKNSKMFGFFKRKKELHKLKDEIQESFNHVKKDFGKVGEWITHIDGKHKGHGEEISMMKNHLNELQDDINEIKDLLSFFNVGLSKQLSKQGQTAVQKQTAVDVVQTPVQTAVQTGILDNLTVMERAIVWALINSDEDMKLSYEDLSALLGKDKSTIRGQINTIKQKSEGLILESRESNGKKRLYIPEKARNLIVKSVKVRVNSKKKTKKKSE